MLDHEQISKPIFEALLRELDQRAEKVDVRIAEILAEDESRAEPEQAISEPLPDHSEVS